LISSVFSVSSVVKRFFVRLRVRSEVHNDDEHQGQFEATLSAKELPKEEQEQRHRRQKQSYLESVSHKSEPAGLNPVDDSGKPELRKPAAR